MHLATNCLMELGKTLAVLIVLTLLTVLGSMGITSHSIQINKPPSGKVTGVGAGDDLIEPPLAAAFSLERSKGQKRHGI